MYYYNLDLHANGVYILEKFTRSNCNSEEWYYDFSFFANNSAPTDDEFNLLDMCYGHKTSAKVEWDLFQEMLFYKDLSQL